jgi:sugar O-acyltransferase (sialic acid O-acetyltransferase NeuD family)
MIYGAGGFAREVAWLARCCEYEVACFVDDDTARHGESLVGAPVTGLDEALDRFGVRPIALGIGSPGIREKIDRRLRDRGLPLSSLEHPSVHRSEHVEIGEGSILCAGVVLTTDISIGRQVQINLNSTVGHDSILDDFCTLAPGVHISGWVHLGKRVYVGTGATFVNGLRDRPLVVGDDAVIGAGACVTRSVEPNTTVVGVPARATE